MRTETLISIVLSLAGTACASSQAEQVRNAQMEQADARADRKSDAIDEQEAARKQMIEGQRSAVDEQVNATNPPAPEATHELVKVSEERALYQSNAQARLDKLGARIAAAQQKLTALGPRAPSRLQGDLATAVQEHDMLKREVTNLPSAPATAWEATTDKLEKRMASLDERLSKLSDAIESV